jgi:hypothetical protein
VKNLLLAAAIWLLLYQPNSPVTNCWLLAGPTKGQAKQDEGPAT